MMMKSAILFTLLFLHAFSFTITNKQCFPLIFQNLPEYSPQNDELSKFAQLPLYLPTQSSTTGVYPNRHNFEINDIVASAIYDPSKTTISQKNGNIYVIGTIDYNITYHAVKTSGIIGQYNGTASAVLKNVIINYVKSLSSYQSQTGFFITSILSSVNQTVVPTNDYSPSASQGDKLEFNILILRMGNQISSMLKSTLQGELNRMISKTSFTNSFGTNFYTYIYNQNSIPINTAIQYYQNTQPGALIGYNGTVGDFTRCGTIKPTIDTQHTVYYNFDFIMQFFSTCLKSNTIWNPLRMDKKSKTQRFQFSIVDLVEIIPQVTSTFPNYKDSIIVNCLPEYDGSYILYSEQTIIFKVSWNCQVVHEESKTVLLNFKAEIKYQIGITYANGVIQASIVNLDLFNIELAGTTAYPIKNADLAQIYIKDVANSLVGQPSIGNGLKAPYVENGVLIMAEDFFRIKAP